MKIPSLALCLGLAVTACSGSAASPPGPDPGAPDPDLAPSSARIAGTVIDLAQKGFPGASVKLCATGCREVQTDSAGRFEIAGVTAASYGLHVELPGAAPTDYGKVVVPLYYFDPRVTPVQTIAPIVLPRSGQSVALGAGTQTVAIDATLSLTVDADALTLPPGTGAPRLAGMRVPAGLYPDFCLPSGDGRILAEWAFMPFGTTSSAPISIHIGDSLGLPPGSLVVLSSIDPDFGRPERQGMGRVTADGTAIDSLAAMELHRLTWLVVSLPGGGGA